jgi:hypothetical protein
LPEKKAAPGYAATPRKSLESWVTAVRAGDIEMMCRLLYPGRGCAAPGEKAFMKTKFLPHVRAEMRGLKGELHYGAVPYRPRILIGVVSGESPAAYAVSVARGMTQWSIDAERYTHPSVPARFARFNDGFVPSIVLNRPDPAATLASGRTVISFTAWNFTSGSSGPDAELWIDGRRAGGRLLDEVQRENELWRVRWLFAPRLRPGRHVIVAGVRGSGRIAANAWLLTVR